MYRIFKSLLNSDLKKTFFKVVFNWPIIRYDFDTRSAMVSNAELWCYHEKAVEQTVGLLVVGDATVMLYRRCCRVISLETGIVYYTQTSSTLHLLICISILSSFI